MKGNKSKDVSRVSAHGAIDVLFHHTRGAIGLGAIPEALNQGVMRPGERVACVLTGHDVQDVDPRGTSLTPMIGIVAEKAEFISVYDATERKY